MWKFTVFIWSSFLVTNIFSITFKFCPESDIQDDLELNKLLGVWYLHSISSHSKKDIAGYKPDCDTADIKRITNVAKVSKRILATDYRSYVLLAKCVGKNVVASILTRSTAPSENTIIFASNFLEQIEFPMESMRMLADQQLCVVYVNHS